MADTPKVSVEGIDWSDFRVELDAIIRQRFEEMKKKHMVDTITDLAQLLQARLALELISQATEEKERVKFVGECGVCHKTVMNDDSRIMDTVPDMENHVVSMSMYHRKCFMENIKGESSGKEGQA